VIYHIAPDAIVVLDVFAKKTAATPRPVIKECRKRLAAFNQAVTERRPHARR
jgi:phage-related protein